MVFRETLVQFHALSMSETRICPSLVCPVSRGQWKFSLSVAKHRCSFKKFENCIKRSHSDFAFHNKRHLQNFVLRTEPGRILLQKS